MTLLAHDVRREDYSNKRSQSQKRTYEVGFFAIIGNTVYGYSCFLFTLYC
ncbi:hypothetical protein HMPREF0454_01856 [Hafnia alvei ATCC 51873]|uniref:Uncharacterized protein n=1 Tax=Hafnia alvei ATCC 51873 TaxID=1002364 RepID=G9Y5R0_HAFAL|nr:hypothetical protein HMPREF0454_01856 [Hafnia alvei ATCC 51873]